MIQSLLPTRRIHSLLCACAGIVVMVRTQRNAQIHIVAALVVVAAGCCFHVSAVEWCFLASAIAAVWTMEAVNTAFESLADVASPDYHPLVKRAKDIAAGAVLIASIGAAVVGALVLGPYFWALLG